MVGSPELIKAVIADQDIDRNNMRLMPAAITQIVEQAPDKSVLWDFNPRLPSGRILCASERDGAATVTAVLEDGLPDHFRLAPGYVIEAFEFHPDQPDVKQVTKIKLVSIGLVLAMPEAGP